MLKKLVIRNIALMDFAEVDFEKGLNVLSGETGAGKSVIIDSLNFVLGAKADKTLIRYGKEACSVQAVFEVPDIEALKEVLRSFDIEDDELIIARKFGADGRGEIKVNGFPFTAGMLKKITQYLVDIHGQSDHFYLLKESNQLELIDGYAQDSVTAVKAKLRAEFARLKEIREELEALGGDESARAMRLDILDYQIREISEAELVEGEEESLAPGEGKARECGENPAIAFRRAGLSQRRGRRIGHLADGLPECRGAFPLRRCIRRAGRAHGISAI